MKRMLLRIWIFLLLGVCAYSGFGLAGIEEVNEEAITDNPEYIAELESRIGLLEMRISQLEENYERVLKIISGANRETISTNQAARTGEPWKDKQNWRRLQLGMSTDAVVRILGNPEHIDKYPFAERWDYLGGGNVDFNEDGRVDSWSEPLFWPD